VGIFTKSKGPQAGSQAPPGTEVMGSGRRLQSSLPPQQTAEILQDIFEGYKPRKYPELPRLVPTGIQWTAPEATPVLALSGTGQSDDFLLFTFAATPGGTQAGLFPPGSGDARLTLSVVGHWKMRDNSLSSTGTWPAATVRLTPPPVTDQLVDATLTAAGYPLTPANRQRLATMMYDMFLAKCWEFIGGQSGQSVAQRFVDGQRRAADRNSLTGPIRAALQGLAEWNSGVLPYIQDLPYRVHALLMETARAGAGVWQDMDRR
jgi:hypothetical protein